MRARLNLIAALLALASGAVSAAAPAYRTTESTTLGHALYIAQEGDSLKAMATLMLAERGRELGKDADLSLIYLADAYYDQGVKKLASQHYLQVANDTSAKQRYRDLAWLRHARILHEQGEHEAALAAIGRIEKSLDDGDASEAAMIKARALLAAGKIDAAVNAVPGSIKNNSRWALYQRYNIGSLLLGEYNNKYGAAILHKLSEIDSGKQPEMAALKDQASLALGYSLLKISKAGKARGYLQQVRLNNLMSNMALLGMGWSFAIEGDYEKALVYWLELNKRPLASTYSYESSLAIPYAFGQAGAYNQSINHYKMALNRFDKESSAMNAAKAAIGTPRYVKLINSAANDEYGWIANWNPGSDAAEEQFLPLFMDSPEFQDELKEYRALLRLNNYAVALSNEIIGHEKRSGATMPQLRQQHEQLLHGISQAVGAKQQRLQKLSIDILDRYQQQLTLYLQQARFGMAQVIEQATQKETR